MSLPKDSAAALDEASMAWRLLPLAAAVLLASCVSANTHSRPLPAAEQTFSKADPAVAFRDPDRRKKLESVFPRIDEIGEDEVKKQGLPGLLIGVVIDGELAYVKGFGVTDVSSSTRPDADTVYRIGSITKSFTALALLSLRDDGLLSIDDPLTRWIPEAGGLIYPTRDSPPITLRQLLTHTSGLPAKLELPHARLDRAPSEEELVQALTGLSLESPPGTRYLYSNLGFQLLGIVVAHAGRAPYREVVNRRVLAPLGMTSTFWDRASAPAGHLATSYEKGPNGHPMATPHTQRGAQEGSGGLYSTARDLARYVAFQLAAYPPRSAPEDGPVRRSSVREGQFNALLSSLRVRPSQAPRKGESLVDVMANRYGYGWVSAQTCELDNVIWHTGGIDGYRAEVAFLPEQGVGLIVLMNLAYALPQPIVDRTLLELRRTGGLSKRSPTPSPALETAMQRLLAVYNTWDEAAYRAMRTPGEPAPMSEEREELAGYKALHGVCRGYTPTRVRAPDAAVFTIDCERGAFEMDVTLAADGLILGFAGTSRALPVPPELRELGARVAGLIQEWDEGTYQKHLTWTKKPREEVVRGFKDLRAVHGACSVKSLLNVVFDKKLVLECDHGGDLVLTLSVAPENRDAVTSYLFESIGQATCPAR